VGLNSKQIGIVILAVVVVGIAALLLMKKRPGQVAQGPKDECAVEKSQARMPDGYMRGRIEQDQAIEVQKNYYACNPLERGQFVMFHISTELPPVIKEVVGIEGDTFALERDKEDDGWRISINGKPLIASTGKPYYLGNSKREPVLLAHQKETNGKIGEGKVLILSHVPRGNSDSGTFGLVEKKNIVARVVPQPQNTTANTQ
jgi:signal peptidase I